MSETASKLETIRETLEKHSRDQGARRSTLRESLISRLEQAQQKTYEVQRLKRLCELLDKHPDVLEILELIRDTGVM